jgi:hypothetical protein
MPCTYPRCECPRDWAHFPCRLATRRPYHEGRFGVMGREVTVTEENLPRDTLIMYALRMQAKGIPYIISETHHANLLSAAERLKEQVPAFAAALRDYALHAHITKVAADGPSSN